MNKENEIFKPSEELIAFASEFSDNYKTLKEGEYCSSSKNYVIHYVNRIIDINTGAFINTDARISLSNDSSLFEQLGIIELDKTKLSKTIITSDYVFYVIMWCVYSCISRETRLKVDEAVINYYLTTGRSNKNVAIGIIEAFSKSPDSFEHERYLKISKFITDYQDKNKQDAN